MKTLILIFILLIGLGFITSCDKNDDTPKQENAINGSWNLKNVSGGFAGINIDYTLGEVKWTFIRNNNTLIVENYIDSTGTEDIYAGLDSGTYSYEIELEGEKQLLFIDDIKRGEINIIDDILKIDYGVVADGFITIFVR